MGISSQFPATIVVVFGHSLPIAREWVEHHLTLPDEIPVILVENLIYPYPEITAWLLWAVQRKPNFTLLTRMRELYPVTWMNVGHGHALDCAMQYVHTKYVITLDSDAFILDPQVVYDMVSLAEEKGFVIVGFKSDKTALPYVFPFCALYLSDIARKYKFAPRIYQPAIPEEFMQFYREECESDDVWARARLTYIDVGAEIYLRTKIEGLPTYDEFSFHQRVEHRWLGTPYVVWEENLKLGNEKHRRRLHWL